MITAASSPESLLDINELKKGSIICDVSVPKNIVGKPRPQNKDITIIEGGLIKPPYPVNFGVYTGLPSNIISGCLAETMLLTFEEKFTSYSLGDNINSDKLEEIADIGVQHGFEVWVPVLIFVLFLQFSLATLNPVYAENLITSQVQRSSEITKEEQEIRDKIEKGDRVFIQEISIFGYSLITEDAMEETVAPYRNKWLGLSDILQIIERINQLYLDQNMLSADITYQVIDPELIIQIKEKNVS